MDAKYYEVLAMAMRYFFTAVGALIVWRAFSWLIKDRHMKHRRLKQLPDAGTIGVFTVLSGSKHLPEDATIPVPYEGVLGFARTCDIAVPVDDVAPTHLDFVFRNGHGLYIRPRCGCEAVVDGIPLLTHQDSSQYPMQHGSVLEIGQAVLRLGVFAGLNVPEVAFEQPLHPEPPEQPWQPMPQQPWYPPAPPVPPDPWNAGGDGDGR